MIFQSYGLDTSTGRSSMLMTCFMSCLMNHGLKITTGHTKRLIFVDRGLPLFTQWTETDTKMACAPRASLGMHGGVRLNKSPLASNVSGSMEMGHPGVNVNACSVVQTSSPAPSSKIGVNDAIAGVPRLARCPAASPGWT